jgi:hypothetical protein
LQPADGGGQKLDSLLKEEALHNTELQERWGVCLDGELFTTNTTGHLYDENEKE